MRSARQEVVPEDAVTAIAPSHRVSPALSGLSPVMGRVSYDRAGRQRVRQPRPFVIPTKEESVDAGNIRAACAEKIPPSSE
jgi:hypothetical protein